MVLNSPTLSPKTAQFLNWAISSKLSRQNFSTHILFHIFNSLHSIHKEGWLTLYLSLYLYSYRHSHSYYMSVHLYCICIYISLDIHRHAYFKLCLNEMFPDSTTKWRPALDLVRLPTKHPLLSSDFFDWYPHPQYPQ